MKASEKQTSNFQSITGNIWLASGSFLVFFIFSLITTVGYSYLAKKKIAELIVDTNSEAIATRDLRPVVSALDRARSGNFDTIKVVTGKDIEILSLNGERNKNFLRVPIKIVLPVSSLVTDRIEFTFDSIPYLPTSLLISLLLSVMFALLNSKTRSRLLERHAIELQIERAGAILKIAQQVAHDIRSPLAALEMVMADAKTLPEDQRVLVRSATTRIRDIANDLLNQNKSTSVADANETPSPQLLSALVDLIVSEKRVQYRAKSGIEIEASLGAEAFGLFADICPNEFKRILSNLVNNCVEAMDTGAVRVSVQNFNGKVEVEVTDNGKGMPEEILSKLGTVPGITSGKAGTDSGSGLGVFHAKQIIERWGGQLEIRSTLGKGTSVKIIFPLKPTPAWFATDLTLSVADIPVVVDDDDSILNIWRGKFSKLGIEQILHFNTASSFRIWFENQKDKVAFRFLFDFELLGSNESGLDLIESLRLSERSTLVTSRFEEEEILARLAISNLKMLPKGLVPYVPLKLIEGKRQSAYLDAILLDDDMLMHSLWKMSAKQNDKRLICCSTIVELENALAGISQDTPIYLDSSIPGENLKGEELGKKLFERGFRNIYLSTGFQAESFPGMPWIKGIVGKKAPWA